MVGAVRREFGLCEKSVSQSAMSCFVAVVIVVNCAKIWLKHADESIVICSLGFMCALCMYVWTEFYAKLTLY